MIPYKKLSILFSYAPEMTVIINLWIRLKSS